MHFYPHHIADFNNATRHLGRLERSIYRDCIEMYYDTEGPLDGTDLERLQRRLLCHSDAEKVALDFILSEFFEEEGGIYMNGRCDREIAIYKSRDKEAAQKQDAANERKRRYRDDRRDMFAGLRTVGVVPDFNIKMDELRALYSKHCQVNESSSKDDANGTSQERPEDASGTTKIEPLTINQETLTTNTESEENASESDYLVNFWNGNRPSNAQVKLSVWSKKVKARLKTFTADEIKQAMLFVINDSWYQSNSQVLIKNVIDSDDRCAAVLEKSSQPAKTNQVANYEYSQPRQSGSRSFDDMLDAQLAEEEGGWHEYTVN